MSKLNLVTLFTLSCILVGCRTEFNYPRSAVFTALDTQSHFIQASNPNDISNLGSSAGGYAGRHSDYETSEMRWHFSIELSKADALFEAYRDRIHDEILKRADTASGGEKPSQGPFRSFGYDYALDSYHGSFNTYSFITTNGEMWMISFLYEHRR